MSDGQTGSPRVIIIAGPNGAGKSTLAPLLLRDTFDLLEFVNADTIALGLTAYAPESVAFEAGRIMLERLHDLGQSRKSFAFETTLASRSYAAWLRELKATANGAGEPVVRDKEAWLRIKEAGQ